MMRLTLKEAVNTAEKYNVLWGIMYNCDYFVEVMPLNKCCTGDAAHI